MSSSGSAVDDLISKHRPMAERLARRFSYGAGVDDDLRQVADLGLFLAASRYDAGTGPFQPYAMATIVGELKKHLRSTGWAVRVPRRLQEASITVATATADLEQRLQRSPTPQDVADETGLSVEDVLLALQARRARFSAEQDPNGPVVAADDFDHIDLVDEVRGAAARLSPQGRRLISLRFGEQLSQREIADRLQISQSQVHRRLSRALTELRATLDQQETGAS